MANINNELRNLLSKKIHTIVNFSCFFEVWVVRSSNYGWRSKCLGSADLAMLSYTDEVIF